MNNFVKHLLLASVVLIGLPLAVIAATTDHGGPVTQQTFSALSDERRPEGREWNEVLFSTLSCLSSPDVSVQASLALAGDSGPVRVRVRIQPYQEGGSLPPITLDPGPVVISKASKGPTVSSFSFAGSVPDATVGVTSLQVQAIGPTEAHLKKASSLALWAGQPGSC